MAHFTNKSFISWVPVLRAKISPSNFQINKSLSRSLSSPTLHGSIIVDVNRISRVAPASDLASQPPRPRGRLTSCGPGFEYQAQHLFQFIIQMWRGKDENKQKRPGLANI